MDLKDIERVRKAEAEADRLVQDARSRASETLEKAHQKAEAIMRQYRQRADHEANEARESARHQGKLLNDRIAAETDKEVEQILQGNLSKVDAAAAAVADQLLEKASK